MTAAGAQGDSAGGVFARLGGRQVRYSYIPGPGPTVLLLGGCAVPSTSWSSVVQELGSRAVVRLDRPGLLGTPWPRALPSLAAEVATLAELIPIVSGQPVVVAAHSMAGLHAEALARCRPDLVGALVLVDSSVDWNDRRPMFGLAWVHLAAGVRAAWRWSVRRRPVLAPLGSLVERILTAAQSEQAHLTDRRTAEETAVFRRGDAVASAIAEHGAYAGQLRDLAAIRRTAPWPPIEVVVITAAAGPSRRWVRQQARLAEFLGARQIVLRDARHLIMRDRPDVIAAAISQVRTPTSGQRRPAPVKGDRR